MGMPNKEKQYQTLHYIREQDGHGEKINLKEAASHFNVTYEGIASRFRTLEKYKMIRKIAPGDYEILNKGLKFLKYFETSQLTAKNVKKQSKSIKNKQEVKPIKQTETAPQVKVLGNKIVITIEIL